MVIDPNSEVFYVSETVEQYLGFHQVSWFLYTFKFSTTFHLYVEGILTEQYLCAMMIYLQEILFRPNGWYPISYCLGCHRHSARFTARKPSYTVVMRLDAILLLKKTFISGIVTDTRYMMSWILLERKGIKRKTAKNYNCGIRKYINCWCSMAADSWEFTSPSWDIYRTHYWTSVPGETRVWIASAQGNMVCMQP